MAKKPKNENRSQRSVPNNYRDGTQDEELPQKVKDLIHGSVLNLSGASDFYKKMAKVATTLDDVELLPPARYRLKGDFANWFFRSLPARCRQSDWALPADILAEALFSLGQHWVKIDCGKLPFATFPTDEFLRNAWQGAGDWDAYLKRDACIGKVWLLEMADDGTVRGWSGMPDPSFFNLRIGFGGGPRQPPTMTIQVKGKAAAIFMKFWMTLNLSSNLEKHSGKEELREKAGTILDSIVKSLKTGLTILRPEKGRPSSDFGARAAYKRDHEKKTIASIAKELCELPDGASNSDRRKCFDRIKKAANNYYEQLRSDYVASNPERARRKIIRVPKSRSCQVRINSLNYFVRFCQK